MAAPDVLIVSSGTVMGPKASGSIQGASAVGSVRGITSVVQDAPALPAISGSLVATLAALTVEAAGEVVASEPEPSPLLTDLVAYWALDEASGTRADSVNGYDLAQTGTVSQGDGPLGKCAVIGVTSGAYLWRAQSGELIPDGSFTVAAWARKVTALDGRTIVSVTNAGANKRAWSLLYSATSNRFQLTVSADGTNIASCIANTFGVISLNTWYYIMAGWDQAAGELFIRVNGVEDRTAWTSVLHNNDAQFRIAAQDGSTNSHRGALQGIGLWDRALTMDEYDELYNEGAGLPYPFDANDALVATNVMSSWWSLPKGVYGG